MTPPDLGLLLLRIAVGVTFTAHGAQKALGWWGGPGFTKWSGAIAHMGLRPAWFWAVIAVGVELMCGPLLVVGLLTSLAAALLVGQTIYIILKAHLPRGFWNARGGIEFPLQLLAGSFLIVTTGPGALSLDAALGLDLATARIVLLALAVAGAIVAMIIARPQPVLPTPPGAHSTRP